MHATGGSGVCSGHLTAAEMSSLVRELRRDGLLGRHAAAVCARYTAAIGAVVSSYGLLTRAHYVLLYSFAAELFTLLTRSRHASPDRDASPALSEVFAVVLDRLSRQFDAMQGGAGAERWSYRGKIRDADGRSYATYRYDEDVYNEAMRADGLQIRRHIAGIDRSNLHEIPGSGWYLYCVAADGSLLLYTRPLSCDDILTGVSHGTTLVKHPMLVQDYALTVRAAGDAWIEKTAPDTVGGILISRTSGHYIPGPESATSILTMATEVLGLRRDGDIALIGV